MKSRLVIGFLIAALVAIMIVGIASASPVRQKETVCTRAGTNGPEVCLNGNFQFTRNYVRSKEKWVIKEYKAGWKVLPLAKPEWNPRLYFTTGTLSLSAAWAWYYNGRLVSVRVCASTADSYNNHLYAVRGCG